MKTFFIVSLGCPRRALDTRKLEYYLDRNGYREVARIGDAGLVLINTCAFRREEEDQSLALVVEALKRKRADSRVVVCGCLPKINAERLAAIFTGETFSPVNIDDVDRIINATVKWRDLQDANLPFAYHQKSINRQIERVTAWQKFRREFSLTPAFARRCVRFLDRRLRPTPAVAPPFLLRIGWGCRSQCAYCAIRSAIGDLRSKPLATVLDEYRQGVARGIRSFVIIADDVGEWGRDLNSTFPVLLAELLEQPVDGEVTIGIQELHPVWLHQYLDRLLPLFRTGTIRYLLSAVQSGSPAVLKRMQRFPDVARMRDCFSQLRTAYPFLRLETQIIIGYPGETDADFDLTIAFLKEVGFHKVGLYKFDPKPGTVAAGLPDQVPAAAIAARLAKIKSVLTTTELVE